MYIRRHNRNTAIRNQQNTYMNGLMGLSRWKIDWKVFQIIGFEEIKSYKEFKFIAFVLSWCVREFSFIKSHTAKWAAQNFCLLLLLHQYRYRIDWIWIKCRNNFLNYKASNEMSLEIVDTAGVKKQK